MAVSIALCAIFAVFEWKYYADAILFNIQPYAMPAYTRTSVVWGTFALAIIALNPSIKANSIVKFMSKYSLALYCIHVFLMDPVKKLVTSFAQEPIIIIYGSIIFVIFLSYTIARVLQIYLKEKVLF